MDLPFFLLLLVVVATLAWFVGAPMLRQRRRAARSRKALPQEWRDWLERDMTIYRRLPAELRERLHAVIRVFIDEKRFVGCNGLEVTDHMRVLVAAYAGLLVLNRPGVPDRQLYDDLYAILIYPGAFVVPESHHDETGLVTEGERVLSGQTWDSRRIILSWEDIELARDEDHNVVLHEFAHYLDMEDETMDGAPGLPSSNAYREWSQTFWQEFRRLRQELSYGMPTVIDPYGATAPAEFFAVVTEVFFQRPHELANAHPQLYGQLRKYYRLDPAQWWPAPPPPSSGDFAQREGTYDEQYRH